MPEHLSMTPEAAAGFLAAKAAELATVHGRRVALGLAGGPGVGKSTIAAEVVAHLNARNSAIAALVPMDGFHMRHAKLVALGMAADKGAPQTFEGAAFAAFLARLKAAHGPMSGPGYSREIEDVLDDAFTVGGAVRILVVEGNYLLLPEPPWDAVSPLLDLAVFVAVPRDKVRARLLKRHGANPAFTVERNIRHVDEVDLRNYDLVAKSRSRADIVIDLDMEV